MGPSSKRPAKAPRPIVLGQVETPSGLLLILDPGLARFWRHEGDPCSPRPADPRHVDLEITGPDAERAARAFDRQFDPRYLFDQPEPTEMQEFFAKFAAEGGYQAQTEILARRVPHLERARRAVEVGPGAGIVQYNGLWAVAVRGLPVDRPLRVEGLAMGAGEFEGRWRWVDVVVDDQAETARTETLEGVMVDHGQLIVADLEAFGDFRMWESQDGLGDFVFWGVDAEKFAREHDAQELDEEIYGWVDVPMAELGPLAERMQGLIEEAELKIRVDYRPHCNLERLNEQVRAREECSGELKLDGALACGFDTRWGDGIYPVILHLDPSGRLIRVRLDLGNEARQQLMRDVWLRHQFAIVSRNVADDNEPIRVAERHDSDRDDDSGWVFLSGEETQEYLDDADNYTMMRVGRVLEICPELARWIDSDPGARFTRQGDQWTAEDESW